MGEHKVKQYNQKLYLQHNLFCCYCGAPATTTDHIPSRVYFINRSWPEGFEFPACKKCNAETRIDEQVVAFLFKLSLINNSLDIDDLMDRLGKGIANNAPEILVEWGADMPTSASGRKRAFRDAFGPLGDELRRQKCGMIDIGPLTKQSIDRYITKMGKTLFYKHVGRILDGYIFPDWHNIYTDPEETLQNRIRNLQNFTKDIMIPERANKPMTEQFFYRYHCDPDRGILFAAIMFSEQMMFDLIVITEPAMERLLSDVGQIETKSQYEFARQALNFPTEQNKGVFPHTKFLRNAAKS